MEAFPPAQIKQSFFEKNQNFIEITSNALTTEGFQGINDSDEVWILQCPRGYKIQALDNNKLRLPGRVKIENKEVVAIESTDLRQATFGYANRKHHYALKTIPIAGKIVVRENISGTSAITPEMIEKACPSTGDVEMPKSIKLRHPLLGAKFDKYLKMNKNVEERLKNINESFENTKYTSKGNINAKTPSNKTKYINKKDITSKRPKLVKNESTENQDSNLIDVSDDLQWIKQI